MGSDAPRTPGITATNPNMLAPIKVTRRKLARQFVYENSILSVDCFVMQ
jgi:hypothetical protein